MTSNVFRAYIQPSPAWVAVSVAMSSATNPIIMPEVQMLCRLNGTLVERELAFDKAFSIDLTDIASESWLWVLGAYEGFRRTKNEQRLARDEVFLGLCNEISEIRIVLAKGEARGNDRVKQIAQPVQTQSGHYGWVYLDRRTQPKQFVRASFAERWIAWGETQKPPS